VLLLDIDLFKRINDRYGHHVGDEVLREFTRILRENCRQSDILGRWGGEEFLIIVPHANKDNLFAFAQKIKSAIWQHSFGRAGSVSASIGCAVFGGGDTSESLVKRADDALYASKIGGRNRVTLY
jgi:polar amino acid transport system substrate-binding protein